MLRAAGWRSIRLNRFQTVMLCFSGIALIVLADWRIQPYISLGLLYIIPLVFLAAHLARWQLLAVCLGCTVLRETFGPFPMSDETLPRSLLVLTAFSGVSLFVNELFRSRRYALEMVTQLQAETLSRRESEARLHATLDSAPIAILVLDTLGKVRMANQEAIKLFRIPANGPAAIGPDAIDIVACVPALSNFLRQDQMRQDSHVALETTAWRHDGEPFLARIWLSTCATSQGLHVGAAIVDVSDDVRETQASGLENLIAGSRVLLGAISHEIRNLSGAIVMAARNLRKSGAPAASADLDALMGLAAGLEKLASSQLREIHPRSDARADLRRVLHEISVIAGPELRDCGATLRLDCAGQEIWVRAEYHGLLQALLNIFNNGIRAFHGNEAEGKECRVSVARHAERVIIKMWNSGQPVPHPERLFEPFAEGSDGTGLGLYVSRTILRSFGGDLRYDPEPDGPCFAVDLAAAERPAS